MRRFSHAMAAGGLLVCSLALSGCASLSAPRPNTALGHFFQVDQDLYRGAQPTPEGFRQLRAMGVKTVISLRAHSRSAKARERALVESLGMRWVGLPMRMYWRPTQPQVREFLSVALDPAQQPVFLHCEQGEDRTGSLVAVYRIVKQGWRPQDAYTEALSLGLAGWNPFMRRLILREARDSAPHAS